MQTIIGVDLGGTRIRAARFDEQLNLLARTETYTRSEEGIAPTLARIMAQIETVWPGGADEVAGVGVSAPGPVDPAAGVVVAPPNLYGWHNVPLQRYVQERFDRPAALQNDANCAVLAETQQGAAVGYHHVVYITVSTGIGGGIISHGKLITGARGLGGEVGHTILVPDTGMHGSVEQLAAGPAIAREAGRRLKAGADSMIRDLVDGDLSRLSAKVVGQAAAQGDALAQELIAHAGRMVGVLIANLMHVLNPEIFVVGGGVSNAGDFLFEPMRKTVREFTIDTSYWRGVPIVPAQLGEDVGLIGAAALILTGTG
ncbi:MAG: ROK family protein [Anaerolineae bacterium]|nr:ROK family protein [Anaerolineae bacterium]